MLITNNMDPNKPSCDPPGRELEPSADPESSLDELKLLSSDDDSDGSMHQLYVDESNAAMSQHTVAQTITASTQGSGDQVANLKTGLLSEESKLGVGLMRLNETDASMRQRLVNSLSSSFPGTALYRALHNPVEPFTDDDSNDALSHSCFGWLRMDKTDTDDDDELTCLTWLQDGNLLKNINAGEESENEGDGQVKTESIKQENVPKTHPHDVQYDPAIHVNSKPPLSFSCLIFMAIENSPNQRLPVKDIYNYIQTNFPFYQTAPTGWKNSVRHNLSLNKSFKKVEKDKGQSVGKGSLWCIDATFRPNLLQMMRKTSYQYGPYTHMQLQMQVQQHLPHGLLQGADGAQRQGVSAARNVPNAVSPHLFPFLSKRLANAMTSEGGFPDRTVETSSNERTVPSLAPERLQVKLEPVEVKIEPEENVEKEATPLVQPGTHENIGESEILLREISEQAKSYTQAEIAALECLSSGFSLSADAVNPRAKRRRLSGPVTITPAPFFYHDYCVSGSPPEEKDREPSDVTSASMSSIDEEYDFGSDDCDTTSCLSSDNVVSDDEMCSDVKDGDVSDQADEVDGSLMEENTPPEQQMKEESEDDANVNTDVHQAASLLMELCRNRATDQSAEATARGKSEKNKTSPRPKVKRPAVKRAGSSKKAAGARRTDSKLVVKMKPAAKAPPKKTKAPPKPTVPAKKVSAVPTKKVSAVPTVRLQEAPARQTKLLMAPPPAPGSKGYNKDSLIMLGKRASTSPYAFNRVQKQRKQ